MPASNKKSVVIIGAGIAGLTAALCLKRHSIKAEIIERRETITTQGAGIQITPNAYHVLNLLGLGSKLKKASHQVEHLSVFKASTGKLITKMPLGQDFEKTYGAPYLVLKRQQLLDILSRETAKQKIKITFDKEYKSHKAKKNDIIIGADGVWSKVREDINDADARFSGRTAYRALIPAKAAASTTLNDLSMWLGDQAHFVAYPADQSGTLNLVFIVKSTLIENRWSSPAKKAEIMQHLTGWNKDVIRLIELGENWQRWPLYTVPPKHSWSKGNKVLIGDAAHAMLPFLAQGGAMAIEDAASLATRLADSPSTSDALKAYQSSRQKRVARIYTESKANGARYHWSGILAGLRDIGLKTMGGKRLQQRYDWIYGWKPIDFDKK